MGGKDSQSTTRTRKWGHGGSEEAEEDDDDVELLTTHRLRSLSAMYKSMEERDEPAQAAEVTLEPAKFRGKIQRSCTFS